jgi:hypothetical protein
MNKAHAAIDKAIIDVERLRRTLKRTSTVQVRSVEEKSLIKATVLSWFNNHRPDVATILGNELLLKVDTRFKEILSASDRSSSRARYNDLIKLVKIELMNVRGDTLIPAFSSGPTSDDPPDFAPLISDHIMKGILERRWRECVKCLTADAPLAATVMMGGLLEGLLLSRINKETNKSLIFLNSKAPKDKATGNTLPLKEWTLRNYIDVAHDLKWISHSAKDVGEVMRDYRNYIHPQKELSHGIQLENSDALLFWEISKNITRQLL